MNLAELRQKPHLSISAINTYIDCGLLYRFSRIDKLIPEFIVDVLVFGKVIHRILEAYYQGVLEGYAMSLNEICELFKNIWCESINGDGRENVRYTKKNDYNSLLEMGTLLLKAWYENKPDETYRLIGVEEPFSFHISEVPIPIIGGMDLVEEDDTGMVIITDHKTPAKAMPDKEVHQNQQMTVYQMAAKANGYADRDIMLKFNCLIKTKTPKFKQFYTTRSEIDEQRMIRKIQSVWDGISKGVFIPNDLSWKCVNCSFKKACNKWFLQEASKSSIHVVRQPLNESGMRLVQ